MENTFILLASLQEDSAIWNTGFVALNIDFRTAEVLITAKDMSEAVSKFQKSETYRDFVNKHVYSQVYTYVKEEGEATFQRADQILFTPNIDH